MVVDFSWGRKCNGDGQVFRGGQVISRGGQVRVKVAKGVRKFYGLVEEWWGEIWGVTNVANPGETLVKLGVTVERSFAHVSAV